jgi:toxin ParE1/3/4
MAYKIIISPRTQKEVENAIDYYSALSDDAPLNFVQSIKDTFDSLSINPFFRIRYKNVRALKIDRFPYSIYFVINKNEQIVRVLSCFHNKLNPNKRPRY